MNNIKITVVTVSFNSEETIFDTLTSVYSQNYKNVEHLIIDGGSSDKTIEIVKKFKNNNIRLISEKDSGIYDAMNKGIYNATGDVIGFLNSDDIYDHTEVLSHISKVLNNDNIDGCYSDLIYTNKLRDRTVRYWKSKKFKKNYFSKGWAPPHPTLYVKRDKLNEKNKFDLSMGNSADFDFMLSLFEIDNLKFQYIPSIFIRMRLGGISNNSFYGIFNQNMKIFKSLRKNDINFNYTTILFYKISNRFLQILNAKFKFR